MTDSAKHFVTTRWTRVVRSKGGTEDAQAALAELCETYYAPVRAFVRSRTRDGDKADDLTQEFFARVLRGGAFDNAAPDSIEGGGTDTSPGLQLPDTGSGGPDNSFDKNWALRLLDLALERLSREMKVDGKGDQFELLKPWLTGDGGRGAEGGGLSQAEAAERLGMSSGAVKVAVHRMRKRFGECVKAEIAQTLDESGDVEAELTCLLEAVSE